MTEDQLQSKFYQTAYNDYPQIRGLLFSIPNGSTRHIAEAQKLKATGLTAGVPDMVLLWNGKAYGFEFKTQFGVLSAVQNKIHAIWKANGIPVYVFRDAESALLQVESVISS